MRRVRVSLVKSFSKLEWEEDCLKYHGRVLTGKYQRWRADCNDLPIDDISAVFQACTCPKIEQKLKNPAPAEVPQNPSPAWDHLFNRPSAVNYLLG